MLQIGEKQKKSFSLFWGFQVLGLRDLTKPRKGRKIHCFPLFRAVFGCAPFFDQEATVSPTRREFLKITTIQGIVSSVLAFASFVSSLRYLWELAI